MWLAVVEGRMRAFNAELVVGGGYFVVAGVDLPCVSRPDGAESHHRRRNTLSTIASLGQGTGGIEMRDDETRSIKPSASKTLRTSARDKKTWPRH
eukprot:scaffold3108_cov174-Skeletonema_marinoi.AAC.2